MKNKLFIIPMILLSLVLLYCCISKLYADTFDMESEIHLGDYNIYSRKDSQKYIKYDNRPQVNNMYFYHDRENIEHVAYCLNLYTSGAEIGNYDVNVAQAIADDKLNGIATCGYPYRTYQELGLNNESEAIFSTQFAMWAYLSNLNLDLITPIDGCQRVVDAIRNIFYQGVNYNFQKSTIVNVEIPNETNIDNINRDYYSATVDLNYNSNLEELLLDTLNIEDVKITDMNNNTISNNLIGYKQIKVLIPREKINNDTEVLLNFRAKSKQTSVLFGISKIQDRQNMALMLDPFNFKTFSKSIHVNHVPAILKVKKQDNDNEKAIPGTKIKLFWNDTGEEIGTYVTDSNGEISLKLEKEGKIRAEEIMVPLPYYVPEDNTQIIDVTYGKTSNILFKNNVIKGKILLHKKSINYNKYSNLEPNSYIEDTIFNVYNSKWEVVDTITTNANTPVESKELVYGTYFVKEIQSNKYYIVNTQEKKVEIKNNGDTIELEFKNDNVDIDVGIEKTGYIETQPDNMIKYSFSNITNKSNVILDAFEFKDYIPKYVSIHTIYTGTWSNELLYNITYNTNKRENIIYKTGLNSKQIYCFNLETIELEKNEKITEISFNFTNVPPEFKEIKSPIFYMQTYKNLTNNDVIHNESEVIGTYYDIKVSHKSDWDTKIYRKELRLTKLPKTGI